MVSPEGNSGSNGAGAASLVLGLHEACWAAPDGSVRRSSLADTARAIRDGARPLLCHAPAIARRLGIRRFPAFDLLELFAFVMPARFCVPTPRGLAAELGLDAGHDPAAQAAALFAIRDALLAELKDPGMSGRGVARRLADAAVAGGWPWGETVAKILDDGRDVPTGTGLEVWSRLPEWPEYAPEPPPGHLGVEPEEARARLSAALGPDAEDRPQQADYAAVVSSAFAPAEEEGVPNVVLAEAGTGVGKTLAYAAPAVAWAEKNEGTVWISTYTRNLQRQVEQELERLYPDDAARRRKVVVRKGRENYLCLLNFEEALGVARQRSATLAPLVLLARWIEATRDGAVVGGDMPGWLVDIIGPGNVSGMTDHRGECVYTACPHYGKCFIEHSVRKARRARIVVANHALVMVQAARAAMEPDPYAPSRYVFDEGHHVFAAADSAFAVRLSGQETAELRRWLRGAETADGRRSRARGLRARLGDLLLDDPETETALDQALRAAAALPGEAWLQRLAGGHPQGAAEKLFALIRQQTYARSTFKDSPYGLEVDIAPVLDGIPAAAEDLDAALDRLAKPLTALRGALLNRLDDDAEELDTPDRVRLEAMARSIARRALEPIAAWRDMLGLLARPADVPDAFVDWFSVDRDFGRDSDVGMHRHWVDPTEPLARVLAPKAQGILVTSATLRDGTDDPEADWAAAEARSGSARLPKPALRVAIESPFDYPERTRVIVIRDVKRDDIDQVAAAYRALFLAAGGGALGLFTAISRLREVHKRIADALQDEGLPLLAQHVDGYDVSTLVEIFRAEPESCLLGTDAVRDGVDVPGSSLRLMVFERVPWPRPDILHKARRAHFGPGYDDMIARLRMKQAYGRLIRREDDRGVFVMLDSRMPSRLAGAFPDGVEIQRIGLKDAVAQVRAFLQEEQARAASGGA